MKVSPASLKLDCSSDHELTQLEEEKKFVTLCGPLQTLYDAVVGAGCMSTHLSAKDVGKGG